MLRPIRPASLRLRAEHDVALGIGLVSCAGDGVRRRAHLRQEWEELQWSYCVRRGQYRLMSREIPSAVTCMRRARLVMDRSVDPSTMAEDHTSARALLVPPEIAMPSTNEPMRVPCGPEDPPKPTRQETQENYAKPSVQLIGSVVCTIAPLPYPRTHPCWHRLARGALGKAAGMPALAAVRRINRAERQEQLRLRCFAECVRRSQSGSSFGHAWCLAARLYTCCDFARS